jgi:hypothetical protein
MVTDELKDHGPTPGYHALIMSTAFEVFPTTDHIPSFPELLDAATARLREFLRSYGILQPAPLAVTLRRKEPDAPILPLDPTAPAWWPDDCYAWFQVRGVAGGTDAYAWTFDNLNRECLGYVAAEHPEFAHMTAAALRVGRYWSFRRSAGQPAIITIAYGMLAGSLAELTGGFVYSDDGAWDYKRLPARPDRFLSTYFRPELNRGWDEYEWAKKCISWLPEELSHVQFEK